MYCILVNSYPATELWNHQICIVLQQSLCHVVHFLEKGFGFITIKDSDEEIFVHTSNLIDDIKENDNVTFDVEKGDKGLSAVKVRLA